MLVAFVILLCCVLASFFAGVWVGRGSPAAAADAPLPAAAVAPQATPSTDTPQELAFFNDNAADPGGDRRPDLQELAKKPRRDTTLAQDVGAPNAPTPAAPQPSAAGSSPSPAPAASGAAPVAPPPAGQAAGPAAPTGPLFIQVFSSRDEVQARRLETRLRAAGFKAFLSPAGEMYRVRIGPFSERSDAETAAAKARRDFRVDTWITANP